MIAWATSAGDIFGYRDLISAATPETSAVACEVPRPTQYSSPGPAPSMSTPGAATVTSELRLENEARRCDLSAAATEITPGSDAG